MSSDTVSAKPSGRSDDKQSNGTESSSNVEEIWRMVFENNSQNFQLLLRYCNSRSCNVDHNNLEPEMKREHLESIVDRVQKGYQYNYDLGFHVMLAILLAISKKSARSPFIQDKLNICQSYPEQEVEDGEMPQQDGKIPQQRINGIVHELAKIGQCHRFRQYLLIKTVNATNNIGETPLHLAAEFEHYEDVKCLLAMGAEMKVDKCQCTPLHSAAIATIPNPEIARELVKAAKEQATQNDNLLDYSSKNGNNTALHIAAGNPNITKEFIFELRDADPKEKNAQNDTPFHVAAKSNNPNAILYMLQVFAPSNGNWDIDSVDNQESRNTGNDKQPCRLLDICATAGNAEAVAFLIQHGADISKGVLHEIVLESAKPSKPEKIEQLRAVYRAIVDNAVTWKCLKENRKRLPKGSEEYNNCLKETMITLLTMKQGKAHEQKNDTRKKKDNVLKCAIRYGASDMFREIVNTPNVYRRDDGKSTAFFDVTEFTETTMAGDKGESCFTCFSGKKTYMQTLLKYQDKWLDKDIFNEEPIKELCKPYICIMQRFYMIVGIIQLIYMIFLSIYQLPTSCSLSHMFNFTTQNCNGSFQTNDPRILYDIWPGVVCLVHAINLLYVIWSIISRILQKKIPRCGQKTCRNLKLTLQQLFLFFCQTSPIMGFYIFEFTWSNRFQIRSNDNHTEFLAITSMLFLFGWLANLSFFSGMTTKLSVFTLLLTEIIVKDILRSFLIVFAFVVVGFSFAVHCLRITLPSHDAEVSLGTTVYDLIAAAFGIGDFLEETKNELPLLGMLVFMAYLFFAVLILLNVLIAMLNNRYEVTKRTAENVWRFSILRTTHFFETCTYIRGIIRPIIRALFKNQHNCHCCCCGLFCCHWRRKRLRELPSHRYELKVKLEIDKSGNI